MVTAGGRAPAAQAAGLSNSCSFFFIKCPPKKASSTEREGARLQASSMRSILLPFPSLVSRNKGRGGEILTEFWRTSSLAKWPDEVRTARAHQLLRLAFRFYPPTHLTSLLRAECWSSPAVAGTPFVRAKCLHVRELGEY